MWAKYTNTHSRTPNTLIAAITYYIRVWNIVAIPRIAYNIVCCRSNAFRTALCDLRGSVITDYSNNTHTHTPGLNNCIHTIAWGRWCTGTYQQMQRCTEIENRLDECKSARSLWNAKPQWDQEKPHIGCVVGHECNARCTHTPIPIPLYAHTQSIESKQRDIRTRSESVESGCWVGENLW